MNATNKNIKEKKIHIKIGDENISFIQESKKSVDLEILSLNILLYTVILLFGFGHLTLPFFLLLFYALAMRLFIGNHDRMHTNQKSRLPRFVEIIAEGLAVVVTPWDEPYDSIKRKHIKHHSTHLIENESKFDTKNDPHTVFELGGFFRVVLSCLFYEELQLFLDIRNGNLTKSRFFRFIIYVPLQIAFIVVFGWDKFLIVVIAMRLVGFSSWLVFSWVIHQPQIYQFGFANKVPKLFKLLFAALHGRRVTEGCLHHATHHTWPRIPYNKLHKIDSLVNQNPSLNPNTESFKT